MSQAVNGRRLSVLEEQEEPKHQSIGQIGVLSFPEGWKTSTSWSRAQTETDEGSQINHVERIVFLEESDMPHRLVFVLSRESNEVLADCSCSGHHFRGFCAHVASVWWQWVNGRIAINELETDRKHRHPPAWATVDDEEVDQ